MQMQNDIAAKIIKRYDTLFADRATWESHWREIDERISPTPDYFGQSLPTPGQKRTEKVFDSTATLAHSRCAAAMESMLTPRTQRWHGLEPRTKELRDYPDVKKWCEDVADILFAARYNPRTNFASQTYETYRSVAKFGTGALFVDELMDFTGFSLRYKSIHLSELFIAENSHGIVDTVYRKFRYSAYQAVHAFGEENLPESIRNAADKSPDQMFDFIHAVYPNEEYDKDKADQKAMRYKSCYVATEGKCLVRESGYRTMPYCVSRWSTNSNEVYGRGPAMDVLPNIKMLNEIMKTTIRSAQRQADPPLMLPADGEITSFSLRPGALNYGGVNSNGQQMVQPLQTNSDLGIAEYMIKEQRELINHAFLVTLFQILVENKTMTATEAMYRQQEKGALLAPTMGRQQSELLSPMIERELDILFHQGMIPPMPEVLVNADGLINITYTSPLTRAQKSEEGVAILNLLQAASSVAQFDPSILKTINYTTAIRELSDIYGAPVRVLHTEEEVAAMKQEEAMQMQSQQVLAAGQQLAQTGKTLAETQNIANQAGPGIMR
jgi:hypothetical protein